MAPSLRTRLTSLVCAAALVACSRDTTPTPAQASQQHAGQQRAAPPTDAKLVVTAILARALGDARDQFANAALQLRAAPDVGNAPDGTANATAPPPDPSAPATTLLLAADGRFRVDHADGRVEVLTAAAAFGWNASAPVHDLDAGARERLLAWRERTRALLFEPLRRAAQVELSAPQSISIEVIFDAALDGSPHADASTSTPVDAERWTLTFADDAAGQPIPEALASERFGRVEFVQLGAPPALALPRLVVMTPPGANGGPSERFAVRVLGSRALHRDNVFERPSPSTHARADLEIAATERPLRPEWQLRTARESLWIRDPGDWPARLRACMDLGTRLHQAGQKNGGDPFLQHDADGDWLVIPFRQNADSHYEPADGEIVRSQPDHHVACVLAPTDAPFAERVQRGTATLDEFVAGAGRSSELGLRIVVNMFFEPGLGERPEVERSMDIRLERPIE